MMAQPQAVKWEQLTRYMILVQDRPSRRCSSKSFAFIFIIMPLTDELVNWEILISAIYWIHQLHQTKYIN